VGLGVRRDPGPPRGWARSAGGVLVGRASGGEPVGRPLPVSQRPVLGRQRRGLCAGGRVLGGDLLPAPVLAGHLGPHRDRGRGADPANHRSDGVLLAVLRRRDRTLRRARDDDRGDALRGRRPGTAGARRPRQRLRLAAARVPALRPLVGPRLRPHVDRRDGGDATCQGGHRLGGVGDEPMPGWSPAARHLGSPVSGLASGCDRNGRERRASSLHRRPLRGVPRADRRGRARRSRPSCSTASTTGVSISRPIQRRRVLSV
jgi:hypothetical protein